MNRELNRAMNASIEYFATVEDGDEHGDLCAIPAIPNGLTPKTGTLKSEISLFATVAANFLLKCVQINLYYAVPIKMSKMSNETGNLA